ncbi:uncharacterized protein JN550_002515 [Neoarthrinium moseri]|uniref:uncharacterized protein n=1 Tax=Neoarthrinium moseri TaxID=1658444 RepID=UPI001FDE2277|nr:uncharacterized protein JN550_002515 [Neoarthrinium moseri]KAI1875086.1 hypothetical protein JN550_002515 [Neoarthrinium moseri]
MLAHSLVLVAGLLARSTWCFTFGTMPPTTSPHDTVSHCLAWVTAKPSESCEDMAKNNHNPSLLRNCAALAGYSYCVDKDLGAGNEETPRQELVARDDAHASQMAEVIDYLFLEPTITPLFAITEDWTAKFVPVFNSLSYADFADYIQRSAEGLRYRNTMGIAMLREYMACNLQMFNQKVAEWVRGGRKTFTCVCYGTDCCEEGECYGAKLKRLEDRLGLDGGEIIDLESRASQRDVYPWKAKRGAVTYSGSYNSISWPGPTRFSNSSWIWQHVYAQDLEDDCKMTYVRQYTYREIKDHLERRNPSLKPYDFVQVEHWLEKNIFARFTEDVISQTLPSGEEFKAAAAIPPEFFTTFMNTNVLDLLHTETVPGAATEAMPKKRIMHTLGSTAYSKNFMLLQSNLNNMKQSILKGNDPVAVDKMKDTMIDEPIEFLTDLRRGFGVISYLNDATALSKGERTLRAVRWEWYNYQIHYGSSIGRTPDVVAAWDEWYLDLMRTRMATLKNWLYAWATDCETHWSGSTDAVGLEVLDICALHRRDANGLGGFNSLGYPTGTPTPASQDTNGDEDVDTDGDEDMDGDDAIDTS